MFCGSFPTLASACSRVFLQNMYDSTKDPMWSLGEDLDVAVRSAGGGGNVNAVRGALELNFEDLLRGECVKYGDFTSLYPTCMLTTNMCTGRPHVVDYGEEQPTQEKLKTFFGFITCDVQPLQLCFTPFYYGTKTDSS